VEIKLSVEKVEIQKISVNGVSFYGIEPNLFLAKDAEGKPRIINGIPKELEQLQSLMSFAAATTAPAKTAGTPVKRTRAPRKTTQAPGAANLNADFKEPGAQTTPANTL
jgi:hypothetical protein